MSDKDKNNKGNTPATGNAASNTPPPANTPDPATITAGASNTPEPPAAAPEQTNRYRRLFESIHFAPSDSDKVYVSEGDGTQSRKLASFVVVFVGGFAGVCGNVYARKPKGGKVYAECSFTGTRAQSAIKALDESSKAELQEFRKWMAQEYADWRKGQNIAPTKLQTGVEVDGVNFE